MTRWEQLQAEIMDVLKGVESLSVQEITKATGCDHDMVLECLAAMVWLGRVDEKVDGDGEVHYRLPPPEPEPPPAPEIPPEPQGPPPRRGPIVRCKTGWAKRRDGEGGDHYPFM